MNANDSIIRYRKEIRGGLLALGVPLIVIGAWALFGPRSFYDNFPTSDSHWISALGPYDEHLVRDFGSLYLALGGLLVSAGVLLNRLLVQVGLIVGLVYAVPHLVFHASETGSLSTADNIVNISLLALAVIAGVALLAATRAPEVPRAAQHQESGPVESEVTYGTR
jgi:hypothetical protein